MLAPQSRPKWGLLDLFRSALLLLMMMMRMVRMVRKKMLLLLLLLLQLLLLLLQSAVAPELGSCTAASEVWNAAQACASQLRLSTLRP
jgi:hypothetical protein